MTEQPLPWRATRTVVRASLVSGLMFGLFFGCGHESQQGQALVVRKLDITGTHDVAQRQVKNKLATAATGWWWPFATKQTFDPVAWQSDLRRIERFYESQGYYQAEVVSAEVKRVKNGVALTAVVTEGQPTHVHGLVIQGLESLSEQERTHVLQSLPLAEAQVFTERHWEELKSLLGSRVRRLGFAEARLDGQALVDVKAHTAALSIVVYPGVRYRFGGIEVKKPVEGRIPSAWVWEQVRLAVPEGAMFNDDAMTEAQRRVVGMGVFASVKVTTGPPDPSAARIPLVVEVYEAPMHTLRTGVGVRIDQIRNEARGILEWTDRDFHGGMRKLTAHGEAGWAFIPNAYAVLRNEVASGPRNGPVARLGLDFEQPRFLGRPSLRERSNLNLERTLEQAYDATGGRLSSGVVWQPRASLSIFPSYNLQGTFLNGPAISSVAAAPLTLGCATQNAACFILLSYLEQMVTWDRRDNPLEARRGVYASLSLQEGGGPLGGDFTYLRVLPDVRGYFSLGDDQQLTFAARLRAGDLATSGGQSAVVSRFYGGGGISMRGFNDRRLSPLLLAPAPASPGSAPVTLTLPIGGDGMIDGSFEIRAQLTSNLVLAAFVDYGQVTRDRLGADDARTLLWAVGLGARYRTPIGPIRLDFARRLQVGRPPPLFAIDPVTGALSQVPYQVDDSCLGIGGSGRSTLVTDNLCVIHISIGEAF